ncbi:MAG: ABC transporter substrate-binding protein [Synergistaceae bacterium]|nr:ABC transporter substrate-binding protein [Synergistaceae bacterium]
MKEKFWKFWLCAVFCVLLGATPLWAAEEGKSLVVGLASDALYLDPQQQDETITNAMTSHLYDGLLSMDSENRPKAALAESWELADDQVTWTFHLRKGVKFSDGSPFTARDAKFSVERAKNTIIKSIVAAIKEAIVVDDHTLKIVTEYPYGVLLEQLGQLRLVSKAYVTRVGDDEANLKPVGTGPYVCTEWIREDHISMVVNKHYWGKPPVITNVLFRPITNAATRTAALLTGEVDLIEDVPVRDVERLEKDSGIEIVARPGTRLIFMHIDANREPTPAVEGPVNPMKDQRVRQAMSMGIDRELIVRVALNGSGYPTGQLILNGKRGHVPDRPVPDYNPDRAKALLKEAGYEKGFKVKLDAPNGRYPNDSQVAQALASQLSKIGVEIDLNLHPKSSFFDYVRPGDKSSLVMTGWAEPIDAGETGNVLFYTRNKTPGKGNSNRAHYSNPEYDKLIDEADATANVALRGEILEKATRLILEDVGVIPLYFNKDLYGKKKNVKFTPRADKFILAHEMNIE